jgi:hypothetical protein
MNIIKKNELHYDNISSDSIRIDNNTYQLTLELNSKLYKKTGKNMKVNVFTIMKDDIRNYKPLNDSQLSNINALSEEQKIEIIKLYNTMFIALEKIL